MKSNKVTFVRTVSLCLTLIAAVSTLKLYAQVGVGSKPPAGAKLYFDGSKEMLDANWTTGDIVSTDKGQVGDEPIQSFTFSPRFGTLISSGRFGTGGIWIGGMCLVATSEIKDHVDLSDHPVLADLRQRLFELLRSGRAKGKMERLNWWQLGNQ